jgi:3-deoxy-D-manno-octulosonate 8-phosphate phosphatase (KDO 8-P phosphatase)
LKGEDAKLARGKEKLQELAKKTKVLVLDVDGVLTDNCIYLDDAGTESKKFNILDGMGIWMAFKAGLEVALLSGRPSKATEHRARQLGIKYVHLGGIEKAKAYDELKQTLGAEDDQIAYMGDDILDIPVLKQVGLPICVKNADLRAKKYAKLVTRAEGGRGAVREAVEFILRAKRRSPLEWVP